MNRRALGTKYEELTVRLLQDLGYRILGKNYRCRAGEIDLIAREGIFLVFLEVKYRSTGKAGCAAAAVTDTKQKRICRAADFYLAEHHIFGDCPVRFDVAAIDGDHVQIFRDAFPYRGRRCF